MVEVGQTSCLGQGGNPADNLKLRGEIIRGLQQDLIHGGHSLAAIPNSIGLLIDKDMWREWVDPLTGELHRYEHFEEFAAAPFTEGLNTKNRQALIDLCHGHEDVQKDIRRVWPAGDLAEPGEIGRGRVRVGNTNSKSSTNGATYAERRIRRDRPDLATRMDEGELSPHAAMVEAGFRDRTFTVSEDVQKAARTLLKHFDPDELHQAMKEASR